MKEVKDKIRLHHECGLPTACLGMPGIGKSAAYLQVAEELGIEFQDVRLPYHEPVDLRGLPFPDKEKTRVTWLVPDFLPQEGQGILLFDEFTAAAPAMQSIMYQITHERRIADYRLPDGWSVHMAGNGQGDRAIANRVSSALISRAFQMELECNLEDFVNYCTDCGINPLIQAYIRFAPSDLHTFDPQKWDGKSPYACPRTWEKVNILLGKQPKIGIDTMSGWIGEGPATKFYSFLQLCDKLPVLDTLIKNPKTAPLMEDQSLKFAVVSGLARKATDKNLANIITYVERMDKEFEIMCMVDIHRGGPNKGKTMGADMTQWMIRNHQWVSFN